MSDLQERLKKLEAVPKDPSGTVWDDVFHAALALAREAVELVEEGASPIGDPYGSTYAEGFAHLLAEVTRLRAVAQEMYCEGYDDGGGVEGWAEAWEFKGKGKLKRKLAALTPKEEA